MNILIADDEKINLLAASRLLENRNHTVTTATSGWQVLELLKEENFDCILMDLEMPEMDGLEATKRIHDRSVFGDKSDIPIIAMTGHSLKEKRYLLEKSGINYYVSKPFDIEILMQTIEKATSS